MEKSFGAGDRVIYVKCDLSGDRKESPLWKGKFGKVVGTVKDVVIGDPFPVQVNWDNGEYSIYRHESLEHYVGGNMAALKKGDRVILIIDKFKDSNSNPRWGGKHGKVVGTITALEGGKVNVSWDNNNENIYNPEDLRLWKGKSKMIEKAKDMAISVHESVKPYEKYIGLIALAAVIDHFFLGNKFTNRFRALAETLVEKIIRGMDSLIDKLSCSLEDNTEANSTTKEGE